MSILRFLRVGLTFFELTPPYITQGTVYTVQCSAVQCTVYAVQFHVWNMALQPLHSKLCILHGPIYLIIMDTRYSRFVHGYKANWISDYFCQRSHTSTQNLRNTNTDLRRRSVFVLHRINAIASNPCLTKSTDSIADNYTSQFTVFLRINGLMLEHSHCVVNGNSTP